MAEKRTAIKILNNAHNTLENFVNNLEIAATNKELASAEQALTDIVFVINHLNGLKADLAELTNICKSD